MGDHMLIEDTLPSLLRSHADVFEAYPFPRDSEAPDRLSAVPLNVADGEEDLDDAEHESAGREPEGSQRLMYAEDFHVAVDKVEKQRRHLAIGIRIKVTGDEYNILLGA